MRNTIKLRNRCLGVPSAEFEVAGKARSSARDRSKFRVISKKKVYQQAVGQIECLVKRLNPGDRLPPERELAERLAVSRSSIREAIRTLELIGLIKTRQGAGIVISEYPPQSMTEPLTALLRHQRAYLSELLDFRRMLEPGLARQAAASASEEQIQKLEEIVHRQNEKVLRGDLAIEEDSEFHYKLALASNNVVVLKVLDVLTELLRETHEGSLSVNGRPLKSLAGHRRILSAIKRRDATAAERAMVRHIEEVEATFGQ